MMRLQDAVHRVVAMCGRQLCGYPYQPSRQAGSRRTTPVTGRLGPGASCCSCARALSFPMRSREASRIAVDVDVQSARIGRLSQDPGGTHALEQRVHGEKLQHGAVVPREGSLRRRLAGCRRCFAVLAWPVPDTPFIHGPRSLCLPGGGLMSHACRQAGRPPPDDASVPASARSEDGVARASGSSRHIIKPR
jgi:hypothetical protein